MRQVPAFHSYLLIGNGRVARHMSHYFKLESIPFTTWNRQEPGVELFQKAKTASHILILISDANIETFLGSHDWLREKFCIHMSGSLATDLAVGAHPLMTFGPDLYDRDFYRKIPFIFDQESELEFAQILPYLDNPHQPLPMAQKALYHALCVMSGNFTTILWQKVFLEFKNQFSISPEILRPYLERTMKNLSEHPLKASLLTGPLARRDFMTTEKNLAALEGDPFQTVYVAIMQAYFKLSREDENEIDQVGI